MVNLMVYLRVILYIYMYTFSDIFGLTQIVAHSPNNQKPVYFQPGGVKTMVPCPLVGVRSWRMLLIDKGYRLKQTSRYGGKI